jgi:hypothetical protein
LRYVLQQPSLPVGITAPVSEREVSSGSIGGWRIVAPPLSSRMANESQEINAAELKQRIEKLRRFL